MSPVKCVSPGGSKGGDDDYLEPPPTPVGDRGSVPEAENRCKIAL